MEQSTQTMEEYISIYDKPKKRWEDQKAHVNLQMKKEKKE